MATSTEEMSREELLELLGNAEALIEELLQPPLKHATVVGQTKREIAGREKDLHVVATPNGVLEVGTIPEIGDLEPGQRVVCTGAGVIISTTDFTLGTGKAVPVTKVHENVLEVDLGGESHRVFYAPDQLEFAEGDLVLLDGEAPIARENLGRTPAKYTLDKATGVSWDDIGGLDQAKKEMIESIVLPHQHGDLYKHYNKQPINGVLLFGPPGCGKTMLGKAAATQLAEVYGAEKSQSGFFYVKGPELLNKYVGETERMIRELFQKAREFKEEHGFPAVIFIDEADAVVNKRGSRKSSDIDQTIVPQFLAEMDGLEEKGALVILATNRSEALDPAITREGRIDRKIEIPRPSKKQTAEIFNVHMRHIPLVDISTEDMVDFAAEQIFNEKHALYNVVLKAGGEKPITLGNFASGAMIAGIIDQATSVALHRDIEAGTPTGVSRVDMIAAIEAVLHQNKNTNHDEELGDLKKKFAGEIKTIAKVR